MGAWEDRHPVHITQLVSGRAGNQTWHCKLWDSDFLNIPMLPSVETSAIYLGVREGQILISRYACNSFLPLSEYKYNKPHHHGAIIDLLTGQVECRSAGGPCMVDAYLRSPVSTRFVSAASMQCQLSPLRREGRQGCFENCPCLSGRIYVEFSFR